MSEKEYALYLRGMEIAEQAEHKENITAEQLQKWKDELEELRNMKLPTDHHERDMFLTLRFVLAIATS